MLCRRALLVLPALIPATTAGAHSYRHGDLMIGHAWCLPSTAPTTKAFMPLAVSGATGDVLLRASTPVAEAVAFHPAAGQPAAPRWEIAPRRPVGMRADGPHLLLSGLKRPLAVRDRFPLTLVFERNGTKEVEIWVESSPYSG
jgi:copper(I)-binding protein